MPLLYPSPPGTAGFATKKETGSQEKNCLCPLAPGREMLFQVLGLFLQSYSPTVLLMKGLSSQEPLQTGNSHGAPQEGPSICTLSVPGVWAQGWPG